MNKLRIEKDSRQVYDIERLNLPVLLLKGIGRLCECGCGKHLTSNNKRQRFATSSCRVRASTKHPKLHDSLRANISIRRKELHIYYKKGVKKVIKITPQYKELWELLSKIHKFRTRS